MLWAVATLCVTSKTPVAPELFDLALSEPPAIVDAGLPGLAAREVAERRALTL